MTDDGALSALTSSGLTSALVGDILDRLGFVHQFLPQAIQPLREAMVVAGRAMPVRIMEVDGPQRTPFGRLTEALDQIRPGEVYVATGAMNCASWGEILTCTARMRGGAGAVIDGFHRDTRRVVEQNWPVFSRGRWAQDAAVRSSVVEFRCPVRIGGVTVEPDDLVFGDLDGVVVIPRKVEEEAIAAALEKGHTETLVRARIESGASSSAMFHEYGVL